MTGVRQWPGASGRVGWATQRSFYLVSIKDSCL